LDLKKTAISSSLFLIDYSCCWILIDLTGFTSHCQPTVAAEASSVHFSFFDFLSNYLIRSLYLPLLHIEITNFFDDEIRKKILSDF